MFRYPLTSHVMSNHFISSHVMSCHVKSCHVMSWQIRSYGMSPCQSATGLEFSMFIPVQLYSRIEFSAFIYDAEILTLCGIRNKPKKEPDSLSSAKVVGGKFVSFHQYLIYHHTIGTVVFSISSPIVGG